MTYHKRFRRFNRSTVDATRRLMLGWGQASQEERTEKMQAWLTDVSLIYELPRPDLTVNASIDNSGWYSPRGNLIVLPKPSIVTLLHEFRHAMQAWGRAGAHFRRAARAEERGGFEDDARAWSLSLYYLVAPRTFRRLAREGQIFFTDRT